ncbi:MAG TPA: hypothetical protein VFI24_22300 [Pyrinomonadaceae bacterium]|nr:hypothetical protein [Pyrinomonadaceae bacterium]
MERTPILKRGLLTLIALSLVAISFAVAKTSGQETDRPDRWEYLVVAGPSTTNFSATGSPSMRKEVNSSFGREAFVLEQHMDKLGANGWELVTISGNPNDPIFYFKRPKNRR